MVVPVSLCNFLVWTVSVSDDLTLENDVEVKMMFISGSCLLAVQRKQDYTEVVAWCWLSGYGGWFGIIGS